MLKVSNAYLYKINVDKHAQVCADPLKRACVHLESVAASCAKPVAQVGSSLSYAAAVSRGVSENRAADPTSKISLARGKSFATKPPLDRVVVEPTDEAASRFTSSAATKVALQRAINPMQLKLQVQRVNLGPKCSVIVEGRSLNAAAFTECPSFAAASLTVKKEPKLNPRLIIHGIPVELSSEEILNSIAEQKSIDVNSHDIKVVYLYPEQSTLKVDKNLSPPDGETSETGQTSQTRVIKKKHRSCVIETTPDLRVVLLKRGFICLGWVVCRIADYIRSASASNVLASAMLPRTANQYYIVQGVLATTLRLPAKI